VTQGRDDSTLVTAFGSGHAARAHRTPWLNAKQAMEPASFPLMYHYNAPLQDSDPDAHGFLLYGQGANLAPTGSAAERLLALAQDAFAG